MLYLVQRYAVGNEWSLSKETCLSTGIFSGVGCHSKIPVLLLVSVCSLKFGVVPQILWPSSRESGSAIGEKGREFEASRLQRNPHGLFSKAVNVGYLVVHATFGLVEEGRAESLSISKMMMWHVLLKNHEVSLILEHIDLPSATEYGVESFLTISTWHIFVSIGKFHNGHWLSWTRTWRSITWGWEGYSTWQCRRQCRRMQQKF